MGGFGHVRFGSSAMKTFQERDFAASLLFPSLFSAAVRLKAAATKAQQRSILRRRVFGLAQQVDEQAIGAGDACWQFAEKGKACVDVEALAIAGVDQ